MDRKIKLILWRINGKEKINMINIFEKIKQNHLLMMLICCIIPLVIAGTLFYLGFKTYALLAVMLLCPILHYFMMRDMHKKEGTKENKKAGCH
ncbi:MAG: hypothetical protein Q8N99_01975 [Nanoarchaeota archaeon]|nr:hypothetical protein [Nanoarchaeota archaeon]